ALQIIDQVIPWRDTGKEVLDLFAPLFAFDIERVRHRWRDERPGGALRRQKIQPGDISVKSGSFAQVPRLKSGGKGAEVIPVAGQEFMGTEANERSKILLVDDDQDFLEVYWEILKTLPSGPGVHTASTGARALAL